MRVLIVEDQIQYLEYFQRDLVERFGHEVSVADDPARAQEYLAGARVDVAVVDVLFDPQIEQFDAGYGARVVPLTTSLITSGLSVMRHAAVAGAQVVAWTSGEANRHLHLIFAYEELSVRAYCSKRSGNGARILHEAICRAAEDREVIDPVLRSFLPAENGPRLSQTILSEPASKRAVWRALAIGAYSREDIESITGYARKTVGNLVVAMFDDLTALNAGLRAGPRLASRSKLNELVRYASANRAFFLDETVREMYP